MNSKPMSPLIKELNKNRGLMFLALPPVLYLLVFNYIPLYGLILPFKDYKPGNGFLSFFTSPWAGFENFRFLFETEDVLIATRNTILYNFFFIMMGTIICVIFALMLVEISKQTTKIYQTVMFMPYFISWAVVTYIVYAFLDTDNGVLNHFLSNFGIDSTMWYSRPEAWPIILFLTAIWKGTGYTSVIYYAHLIGINNEYYEAAQLDGATKLQQVRYISIPMISPLVSVMVILQIGNIMYSDFGLFYNVPMNSNLIKSTTIVIDTFVYGALKNIGDVGMASAAGFYQAVIGFILVIVTNYIVNRMNSDNALF